MAKRFGFIDPPDQPPSELGQGGPDWGGVGKFFGDTANNIGNAVHGFFQNTNGGYNQQHANNYNVAKQAIAQQAPARPLMGQREVSDGGMVPGPHFQGNPSYNPNGTRQGADDIPESMYRDGPPAPSILDQLMQKMQEKYQRPDASQFDFSPIDNALKGRIDLIEGLKQQAQGNFDKSDLNIDNMHQAFKREVETKGAAGYNSIADQQKANLAQDTAGGIGAIQASQQKDAADREAMLQRLGIQAAGGAVDPGATTDQRAITQMNQQGSINNTLADQNRANNLAQNASVAMSIGQDGVARRSALAQQLQALEGKANLSEMDAKSQAAQQKASMLNDAQGVAFQAYKDEQGRNQNLFDTLLKDQTQNNRYTMQYGPDSPMRKMAQGGGGYAGIANDLANTGVDPNDSAAGMSALADILGGGNYMAGIQDPNVDRTAVLAKLIGDKTGNRGVAAQIAANYGKTSTLK